MDKAHITERIAWAEQNLQRQLDWIARHDARTATILGIDVAMLGYLSTEAPKNFDHVNQSIAFFGVLSICSLVASLLSIFQSQYPMMKAPNKSLIFFGTISSLTREEFTGGFCSRSEKKHLSDLCRQAHVNANVIKAKFLRLRSALDFLLISILPWATSIAILRLSSH